MVNVKEISLIIATYNWPSALELVFLGLLAQTALPLEIIIADDGSGTETKELISKYQQKFLIPVKHVWQEDKGFRKTLVLNKAIGAALGRYIVQIDGDSIPDKHFIQDHARLAEEGCFIRGTRAHLSPTCTQQALTNKYFSFHFYSTGVKHRINAVRCLLLSPLVTKKSASSNSVRGSNLAFWKADFFRINGYNNILEGWGHEDEELAIRFVNLGLLKKKVKLAATQYHLYHKLASRLNEENHNQTLTNMKANKTIACDNGLKQVI